MNKGMNKKGMATMVLFRYLFYFLFAVIMLGIAILIISLTYDSLNVDQDMGQVNLKEINDLTIGKLNIALATSGDWIGLALLLGMSLLMILNGYFFGSKYHRLFMIVDIFLLVFAFILAVEISSVYEILINSSPFLDVFINDLPKTSTFMLKLPWIVSTIGALIMIVSYSGLRKSEDPISVSGF